MEIYKSKIDYFGYTIVLIILVLLSFIPYIYLGNSNTLGVFLTILVDVLVIFLLARKEIKILKFFDTDFEVYYPITGTKKSYKYDDVLEVIYTPPRAKAGRALIIKFVSHDKKKIIFDYHASKNNLLEFLQMKEVKVVNKPSKHW